MEADQNEPGGSALSTSYSEQSTQADNNVVLNVECVSGRTLKVGELCKAVCKWYY